MRVYNYAAMILSVIIAGCSSKNTRLYGRWESDKSLSMQWNDNISLSSNDLVAIRQITGHLTVEFSSRGKGILELESYELFDGTNTVRVNGYIESMKYKVVQPTHDAFYLNIKSDSHAWFPCFHFESDSIAWIAGVGDVDMAREYFRKVVKEQK